MPGWRLLREQSAPDGTVKLALDFGEASVETVLIPGPHRSTVCVSSQAGCTRKCAFCATATLGFTRNLSAGEIVAQYLLAQRRAPAGKPARNVVFMGMGGPLDNLGPVMEAVELLVQAPYPSLSPAHVTVSTSGVVPAMRRFLKESPACLALSLNATTDEVRERVMPHNALWPIATLLDTLREHAVGREVFVEYVLFDGVNDTDADADRLPQLLEGIGARINVIPFNGHERSGLRAPSNERVTAFQKRVASSGLRCLVRWPRGREIDAACGQLAMKS
jgi:23S rRNA (adenine2503-C2)-methyltransferase